MPSMNWAKVKELNSNSKHSNYSIKNWVNISHFNQNTKINLNESIPIVLDSPQPNAYDLWTAIISCSLLVLILLSIIITIICKIRVRDRQKERKQEEDLSIDGNQSLKNKIPNNQKYVWKEKYISLSFFCIECKPNTNFFICFWFWFIQTLLSLFPLKSLSIFLVPNNAQNRIEVIDNNDRDIRNPDLIPEIYGNHKNRTNQNLNFCFTTYSVLSFKFKRFWSGVERRVVTHPVIDHTYNTIKRWYQ